MEYIARPTLVLLGLVAVASAAAHAQAPAVTAFVNVAVVPMDRERVLEHQTVVVRGQRIVAIGPVGRVPIPAGAVRVAGRGKFLLPGLADLHVHLQAGPGSDSIDVNRLFLYVANGVTTVRDMWSHSEHLALKQRVTRGELLGPRIYTASRADDCPASLRPMSACVTAMKAAGYDFVKIEANEALGRDAALFDTVVATAHRVGLRVVGHVPRNVGIRRVLEARYASIEHLLGYVEALTGASSWDAQELQDADTSAADTAAWMTPSYRFDAAQLQSLAAATRQAGVWNTPTLSILEWVRDRQTVPARYRMHQRWFHLNQAIVRALRDAGAGLLLGTDGIGSIGPPPGFAIHRELTLLVAAGLTPYEALASGTRNVATFLGTLDSSGTIAVGKRADLLLLDGNPLTDIAYTSVPAGVMVGGRWLPREAIKTRLDAIEQADSSLSGLRRHSR